MNLSSILSDPDASDVYLLKKASLKSNIKKWCKERNLAFFHLNDKTIRTKDQFLEHCAKVCNFPEYYGTNWDALEDCLRDMEWVEARGFVILFEQFKAYVENSPDKFDETLDIFKDAADHWRDEGKLFAVFVHGAVPTPKDLAVIEA
jgi:RNAse (barnase) inhibitor barstar